MSRLVTLALAFTLVAVLQSCFDRVHGFEKDFFEKVSGIKFPHHYKELEFFDNGEWLTGVVLKIDNSILREFVIRNNFVALRNANDLHFSSNSYLGKYRVVFSKTRDIYYLRNSNGKNHWTYIADLKANMLWAEISYPDWGGT